MAKVGAPIDPGPLADLVKKTITRRGADGAATAGKFCPPSQGFRDVSFAGSATSAEIKAAWLKLGHWKRWRWQLCAFRHGDPAKPIDRINGWPGFALFSKCWREQTDRDCYLPISPCSRRKTDPTANPWDYTP